MTVAHETVTQCKSCPWKVDCVPDRDIPNGYSEELHEGLACTIARGDGTDAAVAIRADAIRVMACHYSKPGAEIVCAGWLHNQLGPGNNIGARLGVMTGRLPVPTVIGKQHPTFEATLPKTSRRIKRGRR